MAWRCSIPSTCATRRSRRRQSMRRSPPIAGLDILVNDAGMSGSAITADLFDTAAWDRLMAVNARGVFLGMKFAIPVMQAQGGGSIVNISSLSGIIGQREVRVGYSASKGAVRTLTKAAAVRHGADNIRVNSVL